MHTRDSRDIATLLTSALDIGQTEPTFGLHNMADIS
jgi:hypothetical protein